MQTSMHAALMSVTQPMEPSRTMSMLILLERFMRMEVSVCGDMQRLPYKSRVRALLNASTATLVKFLFCIGLFPSPVTEVQDAM